MAEIGYSVVAKLIESLGHGAIKKICELWGYKNDLESLKKTVESVKMVLLDAGSKWDQLSNQDRHFISELKDIVYDADDVFDEFRTLAELNQLGKLKKGGKYFHKVRRFFSSDKNQVGQAYRMSRQVKDIKKRLDDIASNHKRFELKVDNKPLSRRREETCSYIDVSDVIGREEDKDKIISMLLDESNVSFLALAIVGMGGLGKTALAQLVFNDEKIKKKFSDRRWVCVSDQDGEQYDVKSILCKIVGGNVDDTTTLESIQSQFRQKFGGKKYFLVLDDVWNEDREKWLCLKKFLMFGQGGSRVVITTRSEMTATIMVDQDDHAHMLQGLSNEDSWRLFHISAFKGANEDNYNQLVEIGKRIVKKCYNNPLAIKVVGSMLFGQDIRKWHSLERIGLTKISEVDSGILHILKLSYHNLKPSLKSCFGYCAMFPKDFRIKKEKIIGLWMAQGYVTTLDEDQNLDDAIEVHFSILLRRCFFQDVWRDEYGDVESFKIHDLMHDIAQEVGKEEICVVNSITKRHDLGDKIRHVHNNGNGCLEFFSNNQKIRSYFSPDGCSLDAQINNLMRVRVLHLSRSEEKSLPDSIGKLLHLRYLDLSCNEKLQVLCESITQLYNLQTLDLHGCWELRELPKGFSKLVNLRNLNVEGCRNLKAMPLGMDKLTNLRFLPLFLVGRTSYMKENQNENASLHDLKTLCKIQGKICIKIGDKYKNVEDKKGNEGGYLKSMECLRELVVEFSKADENVDWGKHEDIIDKLEPPRSLKRLFLTLYQGRRIGSLENNWVDSLPLLVHIKISYCLNLERMPMLSKLPHLKSLSLKRLESMEFMENEISSNISESETMEFFPSLEDLEIEGLPKWKGWWKGDILGIERLRFPHLSRLSINNCPNLISFVDGTNLENMTMHELPRLNSLKIFRCPNMASNLICPILEELRFQGNGGELFVEFANRQDDVVKFTEERVLRVGDLNSLSTNCPTDLGIYRDEEVGNSSQVKEAFNRFASSIRVLDISRCKNLKRVYGLKHLTALEALRLCDDKELEICEEEEEPWKSFQQSLRYLEFDSLPKMTGLPKGMQHLTSLQHLVLDECKNIEGGLPEWMSRLSSLQQLVIGCCDGIKSLPEAIKDLTSLKGLSIYRCRHLEERCKKDGEDFPKIQHISGIYIGGKRLQQ